MATRASAGGRCEVELAEGPPLVDEGRLAQVGLVRHSGWNPWHLSQSHQTVGYALLGGPASGAITIRLYDPNWPDRDDVSITLTPEGFSQSTGERLFGVLALG